MPTKKPLAIFLFLIFSLHTLVFGLVELPDTFISNEFESNPLIYKAIYYFFAIAVSCCHQMFAKTLGIKKTLLWGLFFNILGFFCIFVHHYWTFPFSSALLYLSMVLLGSAILSVFNCLITFIILAFPQRTVMAVTALFAFGNFGILFSPILLQFMHRVGMEKEMFFFIWLLMALFMSMIHALFTEPPYPKHLEHLRSGSLIWYEMHHRLAFFIAAIILYGMTESTFTDWGEAYNSQFFSPTLTENATVVFWTAMVAGQLLLLAPLCYFDSNKIFYGLVFLVIAALFHTPYQTLYSKMLLGLIMGGVGCAAIFPILLSLLEIEIIKHTLEQRHTHYLPLIETGISLMTAGYLFGVAISDFWVTLSDEPNVRNHFFLGIVFILLTTGLKIYLGRTRGSISSISGTFFRRK